MALTKKQAGERIRQARQYLDDFKKIERKATDEVGWLMLKFSCSRPAAERLYQHVLETGYVPEDDV